MSKNIEPRTLKGFKDFLPAEQRLRQHIIDTCREVCELFGFAGLDTPALEYAEILENKIGEDEKLIYKFEDRGGRQVALRYDLTVPLARVVSQYQNEIKHPFKRYQIGSSWRADNPQKGRYREFIQADADIVGVEGLAADAECIAIHYEVFSRLKIPGFKILINSREIFEALRVELGLAPEQMVSVVRIVDKLDKISMEEATQLLENLGLGAVAMPKIQSYLAVAKSEDQLAGLKDFFAQSELGLTAVSKLENLSSMLVSLGVPETHYEFSVILARGLDYYTGIVFETKVPGSDFGSLGSGGRYDGLVETFSNKKVPAVGVSVGVDRVWAFMSEMNIGAPDLKPGVLVFNMGKEFSQQSLSIVAVLRKEGIQAEYFYDPKDLDKQFKYAESLGFFYGLFVGQDEVDSSLYTLRDLRTRDQRRLSQDQLVSEIKK